MDRIRRERGRYRECDERASFEQPAQTPHYGVPSSDRSTRCGCEQWGNARKAVWSGQGGHSFEGQGGHKFEGQRGHKCKGECAGWERGGNKWGPAFHEAARIVRACSVSPQVVRLDGTVFCQTRRLQTHLRLPLHHARPIRQAWTFLLRTKHSARMILL